MDEEQKCFLKDRWNGVLELTGPNGNSGWSFPFPVVSGGYQYIGQTEKGPWVPVRETCVVKDVDHFQELYKEWS